MTERERIIERLRAVDLGGGSHESLSAIAKAIYEPAGGWTIGACEQLRQTLVRLLGEADTAPSGGRITAELRKYALGWDERNRVRRELTAIADRIDAEHERVRAESIIDMTDESMAEHGWIRLPKDADGEPIRMGDLVTVPWKDKVYEVAGFSCSKQLCSGIRTIWIDVYSPEKQRNVPLCGANSCRHYHAPTVEDVLTEFAAKLIERGELTNGAAQTIAEYAAKLRLADDGKEQ